MNADRRQRQTPPRIDESQLVLLTETAAVAAFCEAVAGDDYITVDTEFHRESTYYPKLCLLQVAGAQHSALIDPLAPGIDLSPILELFHDPGIVKVLHAARQDMEIFARLSDKLPAPVFDTQIAAMVCGFGDQAAYDTLVSKLAGVRIDKGARFTDWAARPLSAQQMEYALSDVVYLRPVYEAMQDRLRKSGRLDWVADDMAALADPSLYETDPSDAWRRIKVRNARPKVLKVLRELAAWREREAQRCDVPRNRIVRDESLAEIAARQPTTVEALERTRGLGKNAVRGNQGRHILAAVERGLELPDSAAPKLPSRADLPSGLDPIVDLLKVLLRMRCQKHDVAPKLLATGDDLEHIAAFGAKAKVRALQGWRGEVFGADALRVARGELGLAAEGKEVQVFERAASPS